MYIPGKSTIKIRDRGTGWAGWAFAHPVFKKDHTYSLVWKSKILITLDGSKVIWNVWRRIILTCITQVLSKVGLGWCLCDLRSCPPSFQLLPRSLSVIKYLKCNRYLPSSDLLSAFFAPGKLIKMDAEIRLSNWAELNKNWRF